MGQVTQADLANCRPYSIRDTYEELDVVSHPKFDIGFVTELLPDNKVEITFKDARRVMVHNRGDLAPKMPGIAEVPAPRVLVTTPIHLQALLRDPLQLPPLAAITSATAPLSQELAAEAEARYGAPVVELFGSTETCVIAHRRTTSETAWRVYPDIVLKPQPDGTLVDAPYFG